MAVSPPKLFMSMMKLPFNSGGRPHALITFKCYTVANSEFRYIEPSDSTILSKTKCVFAVLHRIRNRSAKNFHSANISFQTGPPFSVISIYFYNPRVPALSRPCCRYLGYTNPKIPTDSDFPALSYLL